MTRCLDKNHTNEIPLDKSLAMAVKPQKATINEELQKKKLNGFDLSSKVHQI